jgi:LmbE family N-acetylglucosaminyl deacetylase
VPDGGRIFLCAGKKERSSFLKKRSKKLLCLLRVPAASPRQRTKVFWFFFSKKNILSSDILVMMSAAHALNTLRTLPIVGFADAFPRGPLLILAPHPDDESLGCGGLIAQACALGQPPMVAVLTDGTGSHPNSKLFPPDRLRALRETETLDATAKLGLPPDRVIFLRYKDTQAPRSGSALHQAAEKLANLVREAGCEALLAPWRHDPHADHEAAAAIATLAAERAGVRHIAYPVWSWTLPPETRLDESHITGFRLDILGVLDRKRAAILSHRSQYGGLITDDPTGFQMSADFIDIFLQPTEVFLRMNGHAQ